LVAQKVQALKLNFIALFIAASCANLLFYNSSIPNIHILVGSCGAKFTKAFQWLKRFLLSIFFLQNHILSRFNQKRITISVLGIVVFVGAHFL
jgi:hypothetical protein